MTKADKKIAELERRVRELEARPQIFVLPVQTYPGVQINPWYPYNPIVTCSNYTWTPL